MGLHSKKSSFLLIAIPAAILLGVFFLAAPAHAAISVVQTMPATTAPNENIDASVSTTMTFSSLPASGDLILVVGSENNSPPQGVHSITDNQGNLYVPALDVTSTANTPYGGLFFWYAKNIGTPSGSFTVTVTMNGSTYDAMGMYDIRGANLTNPIPLGNTTTTNGASGTTVQTGSVNPGQSALFVGALTGDYSTFSTITPQAGWTERWRDLTNNVAAIDAEDVVSSTANSAQWTINSQAYVAGLVAVDSNANVPVINSFTASPSSITPGASSTLSWNISNASSAVINNGVGSISTPTGTAVVFPSSTMVYTLSAVNSNGTSTANATVTVPPLVSWISPSNNATVTSTVTLIASSTAFGTSITNVSFYEAPFGTSFASSTFIASTSVASGTYYSVPWNTGILANGSTTLWALTTDTNNNTSTAASITVNINNVAPYVVQTCVNSSYLTPTTTCTFSTNITSGDTLVLIGDSNVPIATPASGCATWATVATSTSQPSFPYEDISIGTASLTGACTLKLGLSTSSGAGGFIDAWELKGVTTSTDGSAFGASNYCTTSCTGPSITTSLSGDLVLSAINAQAVTVYSSSSFPIDYNAKPPGTLWQAQFLAHTVQPSAGAIAIHYVASTTVANDPQAIVAVKATVDNTPPQVAWISPSPNATVSSTVTLTASSTDNVAVSSTAFYYGPFGSPFASSTLIGSTSTPSGTWYSVPWNTTSLSNGSTTLWALATDTSNNTSTASTTVNIHNPAILQVTTSTSLTYTASLGSTATSSQSVVVKNTGPSGSTLNWSAASTQSWLTFNPGSGSLGSNATASVAFIVNPTGLGLGTYNATATVSDPNAASSPQLLPVTLTINSTGISTSITSPTNGATVSNTITVTAIATSTVGITSVQFYLDGSPLGSAVTSAPYTTSWNTSSSSNGTHTLSTLATDTNLNTATSSPITVTVNNATGGGGGGGGQTGVTVDVGSGYSVGYPPGYVFNSSSTSSATIPTNSSTTQPGGGNASSIAAAIASLEAQLQTLLKEAGQGTGGGSAPYPFTRNLELHDQGSDVAALQEFLIQENTGPAARALKAHGVTQHFGTLTYNALKEYQASVGLPATGFFGALTRKEMEGRW
jgi:hypothetical protein